MFYVEGLAQYCGNSSVLRMELWQQWFSEMYGLPPNVLLVFVICYYVFPKGNLSKEKDAMYVPVLQECYSCRPS